MGSNGSSTAEYGVSGNWGGLLVLCVVLDVLECVKIEEGRRKGENGWEGNERGK